MQRTTQHVMLEGFRAYWFTTGFPRLGAMGTACGRAFLLPLAPPISRGALAGVLPARAGTTVAHSDEHYMACATLLSSVEVVVPGVCTEATNAQDSSVRGQQLAINTVTNPPFVGTKGYRWRGFCSPTVLWSPRRKRKAGKEYLVESGFLLRLHRTDLGAATRRFG